MTTKRGDVVLVQFPRSDLRGYDRRPALVVQVDGFSDHITTVLLKAIQSVIGKIPDLTAVDAALRHTLGL